METPRVGVGIFIWHNGKFLMGQRHSAHGDGTWSIPGGHLEPGESWEACAAREALEETALHIGNISLLAVTNDIFEVEHKHYITIWMQSDLVSGTPTITEPDKFVNQDWFTFNSLPSPLFLPWQQLRVARPELFTKD